MAEVDEDRLLNVASRMGLRKTLNTLNEWDQWDGLLRLIAEDVISAGHAADQEEFNEMERELEDANAEIASMKLEFYRLHEAICENRRDDAIDILRDIGGGNFRSIREQRNLFPDRVPA